MQKKVSADTKMQNSSPPLQKKNAGETTEEHQVTVVHSLEINMNLQIQVSSYNNYGTLL